VQAGHADCDWMKAFDIAIVGAGPAGMAAAIASRKCGVSAAVVDDNHSPGGQIWRGGAPAEWYRAFVESGAQLILGSRVIDADSSKKRLTLEGPGSSDISYNKLILATGARELFLPFPGWTLPHVFGVGGLQALAKSGLSVAGKRIIVAGSGPLLTAVAAYLTEHEARVPLIAEQAAWTNLLGFAKSLLRHPGKIRQAIDIKRSMPGVRYLPNCWVVRADGNTKVEQVTLLHEGKEVRERCDYLAVAYGFVPNTELAQLMGCKLRGSFVAVDKYQRTSVPDVYCAGEPTGLGGIDESLLEGEVAGYAAAGKFPTISRARTAHFSKALQRAFALRPELLDAVKSDTIVCRCEDVAFETLRTARSWREAKLHFRCGMGPCQGRVCGPAVEYLLGWKPDSIRPPIFSAKLQNLITTEEITHS
jgi:NADPH-dependent 2,4-dienoyl-CoA reductase/sulfur reductase-like enzyme